MNEGHTHDSACGVGLLLIHEAIQGSSDLNLVVREIASGGPAAVQGSTQLGDRFFALFCFYKSPIFSLSLHLLTFTPLTSCASDRRILAVNGQDTHGMDRKKCIEMIAGPEGSEVQLLTEVKNVDGIIGNGCIASIVNHDLGSHWHNDLMITQSYQSSFLRLSLHA